MVAVSYAAAASNSGVLPRIALLITISGDSERAMTMLEVQHDCSNGLNTSNQAGVFDRSISDHGRSIATPSACIFFGFWREKIHASFPKVA